MAHTKAGGSTKLGRDSAGQRLGVKLFGGQMTKSGNVVVRQRGTRMVPGTGVAVGKDQTIFATQAGRVEFSTRKVTKFTGQKIRRTVVSVTTG
ncbi:MAG TPA: 50S ribosomal protein L27 [Candidatus Saccharimonadales bacterium]|nr:50S ribosomal protein L27 [Candidatus Saccharimonadales bacterium]